MAENEKNNFGNTVEDLLKGMEGFLTTKTVVGEAICLDDAVVLPLVDLSFGVGAGAFAGEKKNNSAGGMTGKVTPSAVLVIQDGKAKLISVKGQDGISKIVDMVPDLLKRFRKPKGGEADAEAEDVKSEETKTDTDSEEDE